MEAPESEPGRDLISEYNGTIAAMIVRSGVPKVAIGDSVEQGTLLVEGKVPVFNEDATIREYQYVNADADILLEHTINFTTSLPFDHVEKVYTGREEKSYYVKLGEEAYKLPEERPFQVYDSLIRESRPIALEKLSIPIYWGEVTHREYHNMEYTYTLEEAKEILNQKLMEFIASLEEKGVQIIEKNVRIEKSDTEWMVNGEFLIRELVGESVETERMGGLPNSDEK